MYFKGAQSPFLVSDHANIPMRHLTKHTGVFGATGKGKTETIKRIIQNYQQNGVSVFVIDIKDDMEDLQEYFSYQALDLINDNIGLNLQAFDYNNLSYLLALNNTQRSLLATALLYAKDHNINITDFDVLTSVFNRLQAGGIPERYGRISNTSIQTIIRKINELRLHGYDNIFKGNKLNVKKLKTAGVTRMDAFELVKNNNIYASVVIQILKDIYNNYEEVGATDQPELAFIIEEAHTLFSADKYLTNDLIQIVNLIRSKGIALTFVSQQLTAIPNEVTAQLSLKIQHGLNLITAKDYTQARNIARTFNGKLDTKAINRTINKIKTLRTGEAFIQYLNESGQPKTVVGMIHLLDAKKIPSRQTNIIYDEVRPQQIGTTAQKTSGEDLSRLELVQMILIVVVIAILYMLFR